MESNLDKDVEEKIQDIFFYLESNLDKDVEEKIQDIFFYLTDQGLAGSVANS
ncbi:hypothetical protein H6F76_26365 [Leptolyngbya sp. FACHB-321]|uniref:hypothetical protein n=1 Tax=Leptolyngbya sp. FACHB-321 TaxID=2692807 RepID=UPI001687B65E|nr:hypothetical protein [Leptolyngbya sp. FACHB-321]MBD2038482.1 hypothetical protein [Leptolyngbya sp. FACHB-321]